MGRTQTRRAVNDRLPALGYPAPSVWPEQVLRDALRIIEREGRIEGFQAPASSQIGTFPQRRTPDWEPLAYATVWLKLPVRGGRVMITVLVDKRDDRVKFWATDINRLSTERMVSFGDADENAQDCADYIVDYTEQRIRSRNPAGHSPMQKHPSLTTLYIVLGDIDALLPDDATPHERELVAEQCREIDVPDNGFAEARHECHKALIAAKGDLRKIRRAISDFRDYAEMRIESAGRAAASDFDTRMAEFRASKREDNPSGHSTTMLVAAGVGGFVAGAWLTSAAYNRVVVKPLLAKVMENQVTKAQGST